MHLARSIAERVVFALLRLAGLCLTVAAVASIVPAFALQAIGVDGLRIIVGDLLGLAVVFAFAGGLTLYLARIRTKWLPDGPPSQASAGSGFDGWLILFPLTLLSVPLLMLVQLQPLAEFWRDVFGLADRLNVWQDLQKNAGASGLVLMPIIAALAVPGVEVMTAAAFVIGSALLIALLILRSTRVPRALLLCALIQGPLVAASVVGTLVIERLTPSLEQLIRETKDPTGVEQKRAAEALQRYRVVTRGTSETLTWTLGAMVFWTPFLLLNARARMTFAGAGPYQEDPAIGARARIDPASVSAMDDRARARAYVDAARQVDETTRPSRLF
jgi:hypothetical protein